MAYNHRMDVDSELVAPTRMGIAAKNHGTFGSWTGEWREQCPAVLVNVNPAENQPLHAGPKG